MQSHNTHTIRISIKTTFIFIVMIDETDAIASDKHIIEHTENV